MEQKVWWQNSYPNKKKIPADFVAWPFLSKMNLNSTDLRWREKGLGFVLQQPPLGHGWVGRKGVSWKTFWKSSQAAAVWLSYKRLKCGQRSQERVASRVGVRLRVVCWHSPRGGQDCAAQKNTELNGGIFSAKYLNVRIKRGLIRYNLSLITLV